MKIKGSGIFFRTMAVLISVLILSAQLMISETYPVLAAGTAVFEGTTKDQYGNNNLRLCSTEKKTIRLVPGDKDHYFKLVSKGQTGKLNVATKTSTDSAGRSVLEVTVNSKNSEKFTDFLQADLYSSTDNSAEIYGISVDVHTSHSFSIKTNKDGSLSYDTNECSHCGKLQFYASAKRASMYANKGESFVIDGVVSGGSGSYGFTFSYDFYGEDSEEQVIVSDKYSERGISITQSNIASGKTRFAVKFAPSLPGTYENFQILVKDKSSNQNKLLEMGSFLLSVKLSNRSTINKTEITQGGTVRLTGKSSDGAGETVYYFYYKRESADKFTEINKKSVTDEYVDFKPEGSGKYTLKVTAKDLSRTEVSKTFGLTVFGLYKNTSVLEKSSIKIQSYAKLKVSVSGGAGGDTCTYSYKHDEDSTWTDGGSAAVGSTVSFRPTKIGLYTVRINAKDRKGSTSEKSLSLYVISQMKNASSVSAQKLYIGDKLLIKASATGGFKPYTFVMTGKDKSTGIETTILPQNGNTAEVTSSKAGVFTYKVTAKDSDGQTDTKSFDVEYFKKFTASASLSKNEVYLGNSININTTASYGAAPYKYTYFQKKYGSSDWVAITADNTSKAVFKALSAGKYRIKAVATDSIGTSIEVVKDLVVIAPLKNTSEINQQQMIAGVPATIKGSASGGVMPYKFEFYYKRSSNEKWLPLQADSDNDTVAHFKPEGNTFYDVRVIVTDKNGRTDEKVIRIESTAALRNISTISSSATAVDGVITIFAAASGGTMKNYRYSYYYRTGGSERWTSIGSEFTTVSQKSFSPKSSGQYEIKTVVKDSSEKTAEKIFTLNVEPSVVNNSTISAQETSVGDPVKLRGLAKYGYGEYKYAFYYCKSGTSDWNVIGTEFMHEDSAEITLEKGNYKIAAVVIDSTNKPVSKTFTLRVTDELYNRSTLRASRLYTGGSAEIRGKAVGGSGSYTFGYFYRRADTEKWYGLKPASEGTERVLFSPKSAARFEIKVIATDSKGKTSEKYFNLETAKPLVNEANASTYYYCTGNNEPYYIYADYEGGAGNPVFSVIWYDQRDPYSIYGDTDGKYDSKQTLSVISDEAGTEFVYIVRIRDDWGTIKEKTITVRHRKGLSNTSVVNKTSFALGDQIKVYGRSAGGFEPVTFEYYYKRSTNNKWIKLSPEGNNSYVSFTPRTSVDFDILVRATDALGNISEKQMLIKAK